MQNVNIDLLIDVVLLSGMFIFASRLGYIRFNREEFVRKRKYKPGTIEYNNIYKLTSRRNLSIAALVILVLIIKTILDIHSIVHEYGGAALGQIGFILAFVSLIAIPVSYVVYQIFRNK